MILKQIASEIKNNRDAISHNVVELSDLKKTIKIKKIVK